MRFLGLLKADADSESGAPPPKDLLDRMGPLRRGRNRGEGTPVHGSRREAGDSSSGNGGVRTMSKYRKYVLAAVCAVAASAVIAAAGDEEGMPLPPGWTAEDMKAMIAAGTPGEMHQRLAKSEGAWVGKSRMWLAPGAPEPLAGECTLTNTVLMDGRYAQGEMDGEMPGMGPFRGLGIVGFDNVTQKFVGSWIDNMSTGIMNGVGEPSKDGKTLSWTFTYNCPIRRAPAVMRQVETYPDADTMIFEMWATDPKSGQEYKCMRIDFTRKQ